MIRRILAAIDGSPRARGVFEASLEMAGRFGAPLHLLRAVVVPPEFPAAAAGIPADPLRGHLVKIATEELGRMASSAAGTSVRLESTIVRIGEPWRVILAVSDELDVDLVLIGSHGHGTLDRIVGTTAGRVATMATRDVLVVHGRSGSARGLDSHGTPYR